MKPTAKMLAIPTLTLRDRPRATEAEIKSAHDAEEREGLSRAAAARAALSPAGLLARVEEIEQALVRMTKAPTLGVRAEGADGNEPSKVVWDTARDKAVSRLRVVRERIAKTLKGNVGDAPRPSPEREGDRKRVDEKLFAQVLDHTTRGLDERSPRKKDE